MEDTTVTPDQALGDDSPPDVPVTSSQESPSVPTASPPRASLTPGAVKPDNTPSFQADLERLTKELKEVRKEAAENRVKSKQSEQSLDGLRKALAQSLGLEPEAEKDPKALVDELQKKLDTTTARYRQERLRNEFARAARSMQVDEEIAYAVMTINGDFEGLDLDDTALRSELAARITEAVKRNPRIQMQKEQPVAESVTEAKQDKKAPEIPKSGTEFSQHGDAPLTRAMIDKMTPDEINNPDMWKRIQHALAHNLLK